MSYQERFKTLNTEQKKAVETIDGPLLVIAGPGTGKTELLSMRVANILKTTDTAPENILCLTFTDSGVAAMRSRLAEIIGSSAYKVAIHTFHSFGTEIINQNREYFYRGASFQPADDIATGQILTEIFDELEHSNPLSSKMNGEFTHLSDTRTVISELKRAGLTSDELLAIITSNSQVLDSVEAELSEAFAGPMTKSSLNSILEQFAPLAKRVANLPTPKLPLGVTPLANTLALSMAHAFDEAELTRKTNALTAWRNKWLEKDTAGKFVFKDRKRHAKLRVVAYIYFSYLTHMEQAGLYDYDDMILNVVHAMEVYPDLRYNLQEKYQYLLVDEFQDTNLAQLRILFNLTLNQLTSHSPNIMAVGDDDQAIYSFQGADVSNIHRFREAYPKFNNVVLQQNYRSTAPILDGSRAVITQGSDRLESTMKISKKLSSQVTGGTKIQITEHSSQVDERQSIAESIKSKIEQGINPSEIAVIARRHSELIDLLPYLHAADISVNYERRQNVLDLESIKTLELVANIVSQLASGDHGVVDGLMPELVSHPMFTFSAEDVWRLSVKSYNNKTSWIDTMLASDKFSQVAHWLLDLALIVDHFRLEDIIDIIIGAPESEQIGQFASPYYGYYFSSDVLENNPDDYLTTLEALRAIRSITREYKASEQLYLKDFLDCIELYREAKSRIMTVRTVIESSKNAINLLSAHKSKGLEFDNVYIINSVDSAWGETVRGRSRQINYPENLLISPNSGSYEERLRLYYVAMTRARKSLTISYATTNDAGKPLSLAGFLLDLNIEPQITPDSADRQAKIETAELAWHDRITKSPSTTMLELLAPQIDRYRLSITDLNSFIDLTRSGPQGFLLSHLLHFPRVKGAHASYGSAIHRALQKTHQHLIATGSPRPLEDTLGDFITELSNERLRDDDYEFFVKRGTDNLRIFLNSSDAKFTTSQKAELNFASQSVQLDQIRLTGAVDLLDIEDNAITVTDYKTGKPSQSWTGRSDYDKIKLHKYRQQLMFYQILCANSRDYSRYDFSRGILQFVEPDPSGQIHSLTENPSRDEIERFKLLISAIWNCITTLNFPETSQFEQNYKGVLAFEQFLIDKYSEL